MPTLLPANCEMFDTLPYLTINIYSRIETFFEKGVDSPRDHMLRKKHTVNLDFDFTEVRHDKTFTTGN